MTVHTGELGNPTVRAAIEALQAGDASAWAALFEPGAALYDDGAVRDLHHFTRDALGHQRFTAIERIEEDGLKLTGQFHSEHWGDLRTYFRFHLSRAGRITRLDIGQA